jgi:hypothetical protein
MAAGVEVDTLQGSLAIRYGFILTLITTYFTCANRHQGMSLYSARRRPKVIQFFARIVVNMPE